MSSTGLIQITSKDDLLKTAQHLRNHLPRSVKLLNTLLVTAQSNTETDRMFYIDHDNTEEDALIIVKDPWNKKTKTGRNIVILFVRDELENEKTS